MPSTEQSRAAHNAYMKTYVPDRKAVDPEYAAKVKATALKSYHKHSKKTASRYQSRKDAGLCPKCGLRPPATGLTGCTECLAKARYSNQRVLRAIHEHYGSVCVCCGEDNLGFLTVDHIDGSGAEHRRQLNGGNYKYYIYKEAMATGVWPTNLQILCFNCNCGRQRNGGICPHQEEQAVAA